MSPPLEKVKKKSTSAKKKTTAKKVRKKVVKSKTDGAFVEGDLAGKQKMARLCIKRWRKEMPEPKCELIYHTPYQLLISVVLSAQTTDKMVNRTMSPIYEEGFGPETVLEWGIGKFQQHIKSIGLAPTKAKNVYGLTLKLIEFHGGKVPNTRKALEDLPGVGRKTANVILGELYGQPTLAVDTHVFRVGKRLGWHNESTPIKAENELLKVVPKKELPAAHHWLILHGRYTCKSQRPQCEECCLNDLCPNRELFI